jgi:hypothetical protein
MFAFLSRFYSYSFEEIKELPLTAFFALYKEGIKIQASEYRESLRIAAVNGIGSQKYFDEMHDLYTGIMRPESLTLPPKPPGPSLDIESEEAKNVMMDLFARMKHNMGYSSKRIAIHGS